jgi:integrase
MSVRKRVLPRTGETRWQVDYRDQGGTRRAKQFKTKAEAVNWETDMRGQVKAGTHVADSASITVERAGEIWLKGCEAKGLERTTTDHYRNHLRKHIVPAIGHVRLSRLDVALGKDFVEELASKNNRAAVRKVLTSLKMLVSDAVERKLAAHNAILIVKVPSSWRRDKKRPEYPTMDEIKTLLAAAGELRTFLHTAIFTGMRSSELRGLKWANVDFKASEIRVVERADRFGKIGQLKSESGLRDPRSIASKCAPIGRCASRSNSGSSIWYSLIPRAIPKITGGYGVGLARCRLRLV